MESREYSWAYAIAGQVLAHGKCELLFAYLVPSAATTNSALYNGESAGGTKIVDLKSADVTGYPFKPPVPIYCEKGLYVDVGTSVSGIFVVWRKL